MEFASSELIAPTLILIPALNEEKSIGSIVSEVIRHMEIPVVVIDDLSTDRTRDEAKRVGAIVLPLRIHLGAWGAIQTGLRYAFKHGYKTAVTMDADGQHPPAAIPRLLSAMASGDADMVIGSCTRRGSQARRLAWTLFRRMTRIEIQDLTSGFRAYNRRAIRCLATDHTSLLDYQDLGVLIHLRLKGLKMREVAVDMCAREEGHSRIFATWWTVIRYLAYTSILCASRSRFS